MKTVASLRQEAEKLFSCAEAQESIGDDCSWALAQGTRLLREADKVEKATLAVACWRRWRRHFGAALADGLPPSQARSLAGRGVSLWLTRLIRN